MNAMNFGYVWCWFEVNDAYAMTLKWMWILKYDFLGFVGSSMEKEVAWSWRKMTWSKEGMIMKIVNEDGLLMFKPKLESHVILHLFRFTLVNGLPCKIMYLKWRLYTNHGFVKMEVWEFMDRSLKIELYGRFEMEWDCLNWILIVLNWFEMKYLD